MGYMIYMIQLFQASQVTKLIRLITGWWACQNFFERAGSLPHHKLWSLIRRPFAFQLWVDTLAFLWTLLRRWKAWTVIASHWYQVRCRQPARLLLGQPSTVSVWYIQFLSPRVARVGELLHNLRWTAGGFDVSFSMSRKSDCKPQRFTEPGMLSKWSIVDLNSGPGVVFNTEQHQRHLSPTPSMKRLLASWQSDRKRCD